MLDCNLLILAITDLQLWVLGQDLISNMPISSPMKYATSSHNEEALNIALVVLEPKCVFQTLWVLNQRVHVEIDVVHFR